MQYTIVPLDLSVQFFIGIFVGICLVYVVVGVGSQRKVVQSSGREIICSVHSFFQQEYEAGGPLIPRQKIVERTANAVGKSEKTVRTILKEKEQAEETGEKIRTPRTKRKRQSPKTSMDSFTEGVIKRAVYGMYKSDFVPSVTDIQGMLKTKKIFDGYRWAVHEVLKKMNLQIS